MLLQLKHISKAYGDQASDNHQVVLDDVSLNIELGQRIAVTGPSGSGKTTLLNIIGSLDVQTEGSVEVMGNDIRSLSAKQSSRLRSGHIGFIFQTYNLLPVYTVFENVEFPLLLLKMSASERKKAVLDALEWLGLSDKIKSRPA
ncbi:MAG: ATP-binding cassette domain-containing protein, partial [Bacteroidales bacterium]|nr:ATP-binding cassette domain-containing protein [Bacteroidales bacterium]